ncbi:MAG TPA: response regulator transcription factor [Gemmatimonadaceae bacterium]|jgi:two-component system KDP operon response regulator KdpE|nr:response regulator transcription factor [Gemmatimonadaceae bacterium]
MTLTESPATPAAAPRARTVLVIDDEIQIRRAVRNALRDMADDVLEAASGQEGIDLAASAMPDVIVLDLGLPDMAGADVCREVRRWGTMPIVVLSARHAEQEKVSLLNLGADDYVTKPFSTLEFGARVRAQLRRYQSLAGPAQGAVVTARGLTIDLVRRRVSRGQGAIHLTPIEWDILRTLVTAAGRTLTHQQIFDAVWGRVFGNPQQYLRVHITNLRRKIESDPSRPQLVVTEPGVGYRFEPEE